jgi:alpha-beta hydrolase superfamily lysophospholipase
MFGEIRNPQGERLDYSFHEGEKDSRNIVLLGHGVTGNKDRPFVVALARGLAGAGIAALRFSFSGNGDSEGEFTASNISKEVGDLGAVLNALDGYTICYAGHSMGAAVGVLRAAEDGRISFLVSLAGMVHTGAFAHREFGDVVPGEGCMWDEPGCPLSRSFMDDLTGIHTVVKQAEKISTPWLLVHGTRDDVVPIQDSRDIFAAANEPRQLVPIDAADHVFSADATAEMVNLVVAWTRDRFSSGS